MADDAQSIAQLLARPDYMDPRQFVAAPPVARAVRPTLQEHLFNLAQRTVGPKWANAAEPLLNMVPFTGVEEGYRQSRSPDPLTRNLGGLQVAAGVIPGLNNPIEKAGVKVAEKVMGEEALKSMKALEPSLNQKVAKVVANKGKLAKGLYMAPPGDKMPPQPPVLAPHVEKLKEVAGMKAILPYLQPDEAAKLRAHTASNFVNLFSSLPDAKEMASVAYSGRAKKGWYQNSAAALREVFGPIDAPRFTAVLAATSPQTSVESNTINALRIWTNWDAAGRPTDPAAIKAIVGRSVQGKKGEESVLDSWLPNTIRALTAEDPASMRISGPKVNSFMLNLQDYVHEVTNDAWQATYMGIPKNSFTNSAKKREIAGKSPMYSAANAKARQAAEILSKRTGEKWTPAEVQETIWSWAKTLYEQRSSAGEDRTMKQILAAGGLTHEAIGATPDFEKLFIDGVYRNILEQGGYAPQVRTLESLVAGRAPTAGLAGLTGNAAAPEGAGIAADAFTRDLNRAAGRIEGVRNDRLAAAALEAEQKKALQAMPLDQQLAQMVMQKGKVKFAPEGESPTLAELTNRVRGPGGGFTYQPVTENQPTHGYAVGVNSEKYGQVFDEADFNQDHIVDFVLKNRQLLRDPAYHVGAWNDDGKVYLDISAIAKTPEEAVALSRQHDQIAYYDLNKGVSVDVDRSATSGGLKK